MPYVLSLPYYRSPSAGRSVCALGLLFAAIGSEGASAYNLRQYALPALQENESTAGQQQQYRQMAQVGENNGFQQHMVDCSKVSRHAGTTTEVNGKYVHTTTDPPFLMNIHDPSVDTSVSLAIEMAGVFEGHLVDGIMSALTEAGPYSYFIDIGGNIGMYSMAAAAKGHRVTAFEPFHMNWRRMCNTINSNIGFEDRLRVYKAAVAEQPKLVTFGSVDVANPGHVVAQEASNEADIDNLEEGIDYAWGVSLDSMQDALPLDRPVVMKLDIEGGECQALSGGLDYLAKADLFYVQMEVMHDALENCPRVQEVIDLLVLKGLKPIFYHVPDADIYKELDPANWRTWFADEPNFVIGDIVWKKTSEAAAAPHTQALVDEKNNEQHKKRQPVDCSKVSRGDTEEERGVYAHTATAPSFLMNTHDPTVDQSVSLAIEMGGVFEQDLVVELASALTAAGADSTFIDIGGNIGMYSLLGAAMGHDVVAFEPFEINWRRICNTVNSNVGFDRHMTLYDAAVVDRPKLVSFGDVVMSNPGHVVAQDEVAGGVVVPGMKEGTDYAWGVNLDSMFAQGALPPLDRPVVMKLDIEGGECRALSGGLEYLSMADVVYVQMEVMRDSFDDCPRVQDVVDLLAQKGLSPFFYHVPGTSQSKPLDPHSWRTWLDEPEFVIGDIVWKKVVNSD